MTNLRIADIERMVEEKEIDNNIRSIIGIFLLAVNG